jgi:hypothetical protein
MRVHSEADGRVVALSLGPINSFFWGPGSAGIYYFQGAYPAPQQRRYEPVPEGTPRLIHPHSGLRGG